MPRPRKALKFADVLGPMDVSDLKILKAEVAVEIRLKERQEIRLKLEQESRKIRDKIRIGQKITFEQSGVSGKTVEAEVIGIFADKVQVEVDGRRRSITLKRVKSVI